MHLTHKLVRICKANALLRNRFGSTISNNHVRSHAARQPVTLPPHAHGKKEQLAFKDRTVHGSEESGEDSKGEEEKIPKNNKAQCQEVRRQEPQQLKRRKPQEIARSFGQFEAPSQTRRRGQKGGRRRWLV